MVFGFVTRWFRWLVARVLQCGPIPQHVAFIMDGNRRFARKKHLDTHTGHLEGFQTLKETLRSCSDLGVKEVSVYAFSIENFKRSQAEVDGLMKLCKEKLMELHDTGFLKENGVAIRVHGDVSLLPLDVQTVIAKVVYSSRLHTKGTLNICLSYTSRQEILHAMQTLAKGVEDHLLQPEDIDEELFECCLYSNAAPDVLVRTSGEIRLSDYLLWQCCFSQLQFFRFYGPSFLFITCCWLFCVISETTTKFRNNKSCTNS